MDIMTVFLKIFNMSIAASWLIAAVIILRLLLRKAPRWTICLLWGLVALRLVCPFSIESSLSLLPSEEVIRPEVVQYEQHPYIDSGIPIINDTINPYLGESFAANPACSVNPLHMTVAIVGIVWFVGVAVMLLWAVSSYIRLRLKMREAVPQRGKVFRCDAVRSPYILGVVNPRIYIPSGISEETAEYVIAHEKAHLARFDHLWKPFAFLILSVYWFNPLCWAAYILLCRDIELACDEKVIGGMEFQHKKQYSAALLSCSTRQHLVTVCPLAFGEVGVKERIKSVLNYRKPTLWIMIAAVVACAAAAVCFLTSPAKKDQSPLYYKNIAAIAVQKSSLRVTGETEGIIDGKAFAAFIDNASWQEKKYPSPLELAADLTVQIDESTKIRFYESEPRLAMILANDEYRYYKMKNTDYDGIKSLVRTYAEETDNAADWGVTLGTKDVTPTGLTLLIGQRGSTPTGELSTGSWYRIEVYDGIGWREAERLPMEHDIAWTAEGWAILPEQQSEWETDWSRLYGELPEGVYRICKEVMNWRAPGDFDKAVFHTGFVIGSSAFIPPLEVEYEDNVVSSAYSIYEMGTSPEHLIRCYSYKGEQFSERASVSLFDTGRFTFVFSPLSSYFGYGRYEMTDDRLTLYAENGKEKWAFTIVDDTIVYDSKASTGGNGFAGFEDGDVFE